MSGQDQLITIQETISNNSMSKKKPRPTKDKTEGQNIDKKNSNTSKESNKIKTQNSLEEDKATHKSKQSQSKTGIQKKRINKIYRGPPTPKSTELLLREKSFVLDCNATSRISQDYSITNPKLGPVIPPYNAQRDTHVRAYFRFYGVGRTLKKTGQFKDNSTSIEGPVSDRFQHRGPGFTYLALRNRSGAGHSQEVIDGHAQFMKGIPSVSGYNGKYGFRRNTPSLRKTPSQFGQHVIFPTF